MLIGYREFGVGAGAGFPGIARFYNPDASERFSIDLFPGFSGGVRVTSADFDGDGVADMVAGSGPGRITQVKVINGKTQAVMFTIQPFEDRFQGGVFVSTGDLDGDGTPELVISPDEGGGPRVRIFDGVGFTQVNDFFGIDDVGFRGGARSGVGDINGDGVGDLVVSAGFKGGPRVAAFNGVGITSPNPVKLFGDLFVFEDSLRNGAYVSAGDIDGDGKAELIAGAGPGGAPRVSMFSGAQLLANSKVEIVTFFAGDINNRGGVRMAARDLDRDNLADLVVGSGTGAGSRVTGYLGKNLQAGNTSSPAFAFDAFPGFAGGVFVG